MFCSALHSGEGYRVLSSELDVKHPPVHSASGREVSQLWKDIGVLKGGINFNSLN